MIYFKQSITSSILIELYLNRLFQICLKKYVFVNKIYQTQKG